MRDDVALPQSSRKRHAGLGGLLTALGAAAIVAGLFFDVPQAGWLVGAGIVAVFVGVALLGPVIGPPIVRVIAAGFPRFFGTVGRLARENAQRNPRRTAATASALMIGWHLSPRCPSLASRRTRASTRHSMTGSTPSSSSPMRSASRSPRRLPMRSPQLDGVAEVARVRYNGAVIDGADVFVAAFEPAAFTEAVDFDVSDGELTLGSGDVLVSETYAEEHQVAVGDSLSMTLPTAERAPPGHWAVPARPDVQ